jgi:hypothetical protein
MKKIVFFFISTAFCFFSVQGQINFEKQALPESKGAYEITFQNNQFLFLDFKKNIFSSSDAVNWVNNPCSISLIKSIAFGNGIYAGVGSSGAPEYKTMIVYSTDAKNWQPVNGDFKKEFSKVIFANGKFVAVGFGSPGFGGSITTSADGINWKAQPLKDLYHLDKIIYAKGLFIATGGNRIITSPDGETWTFQDSHLDPEKSIYGLTYGNDKMIAVTFDGMILESGDGINWLITKVWNNKDGVLNICYGSGQFIITGNKGFLMSSSDGRDWKKIKINSKESFSRVAFGNNRFVMEAEEGSVFIGK